MKWPRGVTSPVHLPILFDHKNIDNMAFNSITSIIHLIARKVHVRTVWMPTLLHISNSNNYWHLLYSHWASHILLAHYNGRLFSWVMSTLPVWLCTIQTHCVQLEHINLRLFIILWLIMLGSSQSRVKGNFSSPIQCQLRGFISSPLGYFHSTPLYLCCGEPASRLKALS